MSRKKVYTNKIFFNVGDATDGMNNDAKLAFLKEASEIFNGKVIKKIYDALVSRQTIYVAREATTMEKMSFGRGSINGMDLFYQALEDYSNAYQDLISNGGNELSREDSLKMI